MSAQSVYQKITTLQGTLSGRDTVSKRRKAGQELVEILERGSTWQTLAAALSVPKGRTAAENFRRRALSGIFKVALQNLVQFVLSFLSAKAKLALSDAQLPNRLLKSLQTNHRPMLLGKEDAICLLEFCLEMLETVAENDSEIEVAVLETLSQTCSMKECVVYFKPDKHMLAILDEIYSILSRETIDERVLQQTVSVFNNLISIASALGFALHILLHTSLEMIASLADREENLREQFSALTSGAAILMRANPDLAVRPLREYGQSLMSLAIYGLSSNAGKVLLEDYFSAHL